MPYHAFIDIVYGWVALIGVNMSLLFFFEFTGFFVVVIARHF